MEGHHSDNNNFVSSELHGIPGGHHIALPDPISQWNRKVLVYCHGYGGGETIETVNRWVKETLCQLLKDNWIVTIVAFTEKKWTQGKGVDDAAALAKNIAHTFGNPSKVILVGDSMGGLIVTIANERQELKSVFHGAVGVGAALNSSMMTKDSSLCFNPLSSIIFVSPTNELNDPSEYKQKSGSNQVSVWEVKRYGHCKINHLECLKAIEAVEKAEKSTGTIFDATHHVQTSPTCTYLEHPSSIKGHVLSIDAHGNISTDVLDEWVLGKLGAKYGKTVLVKGEGGNEVRVNYVASDFSAVNVSEWVAFPSAYGVVSVSICMGNAAKNLGILSAGQSIEFKLG